VTHYRVCLYAGDGYKKDVFVLSDTPENAINVACEQWKIYAKLEASKFEVYGDDGALLIAGLIHEEG
jgi:hypothetical protein